ncbi:MAG: heme ABC transporter ATP-binding protein [Balneola sp.]|nr:MAG: heme ABC transporter ATP-binding protein [Balneola sp.]
MIVAEHINVVVSGKKKLVEEFSVKIQPGVLTAVIGKNGAGKSTSLKAITGDIAHQSGTIYLEETPIQKVPIQELARKRAVVHQKSSLQFSFSVQDVVGLGRSPYGGTFLSGKDFEIVEECLQKVDATHLMERTYTTLSGGEQQRVQFARSLAQIWDAIESNSPSYLLLDEPLASLDVAHQHEMMHVLKQLCASNVGVFIIIHDLNLAAQYSDYIIILKDGKTVAEGTAKEVFNEEIIGSAFDFPVSIIPHPKIDCPLIVASGLID